MTKDIMGTEMKVGDRVVFTTRHADHAGNLNFGYVSKISAEYPGYVVVVKDWSTSNRDFGYVITSDKQLLIVNKKMTAK